MQKFLKIFIDYGAAFAFLLVYVTEINLNLSFVPEGTLYQATAAMIIVTCLTLPICYMHLKSIPTKHIMLSILIIVFGGATIFLHDETFLKIKPTIFYVLIAATLLIGLKFQKYFLKTLLGEAMHMQDMGWRIFTVRFGIFFIVMACLNEIIWRFLSTDIWVTFKFFGALPLMLLFFLLQISFFEKHMIKDDQKQE
ncbi:MAG: septation protein IspZ [Pseudomonadota bacterium]